MWKSMKLVPMTADTAKRTHSPRERSGEEDRRREGHDAGEDRPADADTVHEAPGAHAQEHGKRREERHQHAHGEG
jgi:hypothetical protein